MPVSGVAGFGFQQVTVSTTPLSLVLPGGITLSRVRLGVQTNAIRFRYDGVDPTTTVGHLAQANTGAVDMTRAIVIDGISAITAFRMIRDGASDAVVAYTCEG